MNDHSPGNLPQDADDSEPEADAEQGTGAKCVRTMKYAALQTFILVNIFITLVFVAGAIHSLSGHSLASGRGPHPPTPIPVRIVMCVVFLAISIIPGVFAYSGIEEIFLRRRKPRREQKKK